MAQGATGLATGHKHHQQQREHHQAQQQQQHLHTKQARAAAKLNLHDPAVKHVVTALGSSGRQDTNNVTLGSLAFGGLLFCCGAAPCLLPWLFVAFALVCLPWRAVSFYQQKWVFYLIDFCYFVNVAVVLFLLATPNHTTLEALVYALSDGPLAGALMAWQCPWVFGSAEHTTSVLMHLLPGLALFAHRYHTPAGLRGLQGLAGSAAAVLQGRRPVDLGQVPAVQQGQPLLLWLVAAPLAFYITWQLAYFLVVQVLLRRFILAHGYETSYTCLARRAAKTNNVWNRLVRRGSIGRRICVYGGLQLVFTLISCSVFLPTYFSYGLAVALQVFKVVVAVYYGSRYQCQKVPQHVFIKGLQQLEAERQQRREQHEQQMEAHRYAAAAAVQLCTGCKASTLQRRSCAAEVAAAATGVGMQTPLVA